MDHELVSVVIPIYNVEKYLDRCLNSVVNQTYRNLEIILVDDGSPDNCPAMCDGWAKRDDRIRVIHKKNAGLGMARNTGIDHATGQYICFFDSDDYIERETIEKALSLGKSRNADIVVFGMSSVNQAGQITGQIIPNAPEVSYSGDAVQNVFLPDLIDNRHNGAQIKGLCLSAWSCLYSMELIRKIQWRFVSERELISEDSYSLIWLYRYVDCVAILPEAMYFYCENQTSLTHVYREDRYEKIRRFYHSCSEMAAEQGYAQPVLSGIGGLFLSFSIAAMKQIAKADIPARKKSQLLGQIVDDELMQDVLSKSASRYDGRGRKVLFWSMRKKAYLLVYILTKVQTLKKT